METPTRRLTDSSNAVACITSGRLWTLAVSNARRLSASTARQYNASPNPISDDATLRSLKVCIRRHGAVSPSPPLLRAAGYESDTVRTPAAPHHNLGAIATAKQPRGSELPFAKRHTHMHACMHAARIPAHADARTRSIAIDLVRALCVSALAESSAPISVPCAHLSPVDVDASLSGQAQPPPSSHAFHFTHFSKNQCFPEAVLGVRL
jgi:hypothetical protein